MVGERSIILLGGAVAMAGFLYWEYGQRQAATAAANAQASAANQSAEAVFAQTSEITDIPSGGELPSDMSTATTNAPSSNPFYVAPFVINASPTPTTNAATTTAPDQLNVAATTNVADQSSVPLPGTQV